ncbi:RHS repeat-associated core domain-containing protein (plasmid) [Chryseobacterium arthrosphaerae]|uniref:RHS repeat-associated core domain-containing protein n=1 Tax=Chryseobacterium arthrosphaerae TaxID=651561 RepID=A0A3S0N4P9_9FLAO|nr:RHS repeat-associated core domain-containing protein [Chryseobacterium arthrosphaerae]
MVHKHQIDNNPEEILVQNQYNELSQLKNKKLGGTNIAQPLQSIDYNYNIRGWLTKINDPSSLNGKLFGYEMKYNNPANPDVTPGRFTGIITEIDWNNASENVMKRYNYTYDGLNRLKDAVYSEPNATTPFNNNYNEYLTYDLNGNIKTLKRNAFPVTGTTATQVDDLVYDYTGNRLTKVTENALNDTGYEGGNNAISYDLNGNMKDMLDKGIQSIAYNYLNLSDKLTIQQPNPFGAMTEGYISYLYRADGTKLRKNYFIPGGRGYVAISRVTEYLDGFQYSYREGASSCLTCRTETSFEAQAYKNSLIDFPVQEPQWNLDFVATAEGYYSFMENRYIYQYKDHLGNARVNFAKDSAGALQIIDTNNYYPFGLSHTGGNGLNISNSGSFNSYKYNGKELQETGMFDYGWRQYMPDLGRWNGMDQLSEAYTSTSPFAYVANNPVSMRDPDGRWMDANGHIDTSGNANPFRDMAQSRLLMNEFLGRNPGEGGGGGYLAFGQTQAYADLMTAFFNGGTGGLTNKNGTLMWWTNYDDPDPNVKGIGMLSMLKLSSYSDIPEIRQSYYNFNPYKPDNTPEWYGFGGRANWGLQQQLRV